VLVVKTGECYGPARALAKDNDELNGFQIPSGAPLAHRFSTDHQHYVYDVNTSRILRVDKVTWDVLEHHGQLTEDEIVNRLRESHQCGAVQKASRDIAAAQKEKGILLPSLNVPPVLPSKDEIRKQVLTECQQLILNVTERCTFGCLYCAACGPYAKQVRTERRDMPWSVAEAALEEFALHCQQTEYKAITFYGGEPLLNEALIRKVVAWVHQRKLDSMFGLTVNASVLDDPIGDFLADESFAVNVSLDGPSAYHDRFRRTVDNGPTWNTVVANTRRFLDRHPEYATGKKNFGLSVVICPGTDLTELDRFFSQADWLPETMTVMAALADTSETTLLDNLPEGAEGVTGVSELRQAFIDDITSGRMIDNLRTAASAFRQSMFHDPFIRIDKRRLMQAGRMNIAISSCIPGARRRFVTVDGTYYPCERVSEKELYAIGNTVDGIDAAKAAALLHRYASAALQDCPTCWCAPICSAGCLASLSGEDESFEEEKRSLCSGQQRMLDEALRTYCSIREENPKAFEYMKLIKTV
jgi:uncharacterized protein